MPEDLRSRAAYHGPAWQSRETSLSQEIRDGEIWAALACDAEWTRLRHVLLYLPGPAIAELDDPDASLHLRRLDHPRLRLQHAAIVRAFRACGVEVHLVDSSGVDDRRHPNLMFQRDTFWQTPHGAVVARMASPVRAGEEKHTALTLARLYVPIAMTIGGRGTLEGADCLWVHPRKVLCGVGLRTDREAYVVLREFLGRHGIECVALPVPPHVQHLLGCVQIVAPGRALVRTEVVAEPLLAALRACELEVVAVPETPEVVDGLAFNFVVVDRDTVLITEDAPGFCRFLDDHGVAIAGRVPLSEYVAAAGGLGCATGILGRESAENAR